MGSPGREERVSDRDILKAVALSPDPFVTPKEMAEIMDYTRQGINNRLSNLEEDGYLNRRQVGSRAVVFWLTPKGREYIQES